MHGGVAMRLNSALLVLAVATGASAALPTRTPLAPGGPIEGVR